MTPRQNYFAFPETARVVALDLPARLVVIVAGALALFYFTWRLTTFNPDAIPVSIALYCAELFGMTMITLHTFMVWHLVERKAPPPAETATVDVFIPTYNEPVEMLRRTLIAAQHMKHPHETWLLDDGNRTEMAQLAGELGVHYLARTDNRHAKAGNLNNGLAHSKGEFIAIFDADHVPHQDYLMKTLGYFRSPGVAFVQTPQDFYNLDSFQHRRSARRNAVWTEQSLFFRVIMPGKDYWNASFFCGSCATARRSAIEAIGGFATETVTEDLHTSVRLHKKGFGSIYHAESLAFGIAPDTFEPYETQRVRWGQGAMQVWRLEGILTAGGLTWPQRLCYLASVATYFDGWQKAFMYLLPAFVLATGILPVFALDWNFFLHFVPWALMSFWACEELGRGYARSWMIEQYNFLRYPGFAFATLTFFLNRRLKFRVTKKVGGISQTRRLVPHLAIIGMSFAAVLIGAVRYISEHYMPASAFYLNLLWVGVVVAISTSAVRFALRRSKQERASYRFRVPVPIILKWPGREPEILATDDISSDGFRLRLAPGAGFATRTRVDADLVLPTGRSPVTVEAMRNWSDTDEAGHTVNRLGMRFVWGSRNAADNLNRFLYGSNSEWLFSGLHERLPTPLDRIRAALQAKPAEGAEMDAEWLPGVLLVRDFSHSAVGLIATSVGGADAAFLFDKPLPLDNVVVLSSEADEHVMRYRITAILPHVTLDSILYLHRMSRQALADDRPVDWDTSETIAKIGAVA